MAISPYVRAPPKTGFQCVSQGFGENSKRKPYKVRMTTKVTPTKAAPMS
jgi:hypothetical protein